MTTDSNSKGEKLSDILGQMKVEYQRNFPQKILNLQKLFASSDWPQLAEEFHKLKGTGKTYGFPEVSTLCEAMEIYCRQGGRDQQLLKDTLAVLEKMQTSWASGQNFNLHADPESVRILALGKGPKP